MLQIKKLRDNAQIPQYMSEGAAGMDLYAALDAPVVISPGRHALIGTGLALAIPLGFEAQVRPRSGLAAKHAVTVLNSPGTIDCDYRGEVKVILINHGDTEFVVQSGERIAQLVIAAAPQVGIAVVTVLDDTARGSDGFGSTGAGIGAIQKQTSQNHS